MCYVNGELHDVDSIPPNAQSVHYVKTLSDDNAIFSLDPSTKDFFHTLWHSSTHILAYALESYYGDKVTLLHGPPGEGVPYCFFYEVILDVEPFVL